jgi:hypothetical protein
VAVSGDSAMQRPTSSQVAVPLLIRLAFDVEGEGRFFSALQAFTSRTCYGNVSGDHLVGWANSTLRFTDELPELNLHCRTSTPIVKGVVRSDALQSAFAGSANPDDHRPPPGGGANARMTPSVLRAALSHISASTAARTPAAAAGESSSTPNGDGVTEDGGTSAASAPALVRRLSSCCACLRSPFVRACPLLRWLQRTPRHQRTPVLRPGASPWSAMQMAAGGTQDENVGGGAGVTAYEYWQTSHLPRPAQEALVLARLRTLGWARVDCAWRDASFGMFAHNHIQVTRGWLNWEVRSPATFAHCLTFHSSVCTQHSPHQPASAAKLRTQCPR